MRHVPITHTPNPAALFGRCSEAIASLKVPLAWFERRRQRREPQGVLGLPDYLLKDIGLQRHHIVREAFKSFWRS
jgi:uncharacterized protein YjiS (DUF1127 family)